MFQLSLKRAYVRRRVREGMVARGSSSTRRRAREGMVAQGSPRRRRVRKGMVVRGSISARRRARVRGLLHEQGEGEGVAGCNSETARVMLSDDPGTFSCCVGGREFGQG